MVVLRFLRFAALLAALVPASLASAETLVIGAISDNVKKELKRTEALASYLEAELADAGITDVEASIVPTWGAMASALAEGEVDIMFDSPLIAGRVARESGSEPFVRRWKDGVASYHSVIVVPSDSGIETLADLRGKRIGFQAPDSTSGYMLPAGLLLEEGLEMRALASHAEQPAEDEIGYVFTNDDKNTAMWLYTGRIDAAATDPKTFGEFDGAKPGAFRVIARSIEVPRQVGVHRGGLDPALVERLTDTLAAMTETPRGREVMAAFNDTSRFDRFPEGVEATFAPIYGMLDELASLGVF